MKNAVFNKFYSYFIGMVAVLSCVFSMPILSHAATSDPYEPLDPPYIIGAPSTVPYITEDMVNAAINGFQPYINSEHWVIVTQEVNPSRNIVYFALYNDFTIDQVGLSDFKSGSYIYIGSDDRNNRLAGYSLFDMSDMLWGYTTTGNTAITYSNLNNYGQGWVVASSDNFIFSGGVVPYVLFEYPVAPPEEDPDDDTPQIIDFFPKDTTDYGNDLLNFLRDIKNAIFSIGNVIYTGIKNIIDSIKNTIAKVLQLIKDSIDTIKDFVSDIKDMVSIIANGISTVFNAIIDLGTENGAFTITTLVRRLIIPDDLSVFRSNLNGLMETLQNTYGTEIVGYLNQLKNLFNASSTNLVPEFIVPAFSIGGAQIPETVISFSIFVPFMPYLHSVMSAFMWLAFILFIIKDFPNFLSGFFSTADHEITAEHNVEYYRNHGGF